jgi:hypothetical protein
MKLIVRKTLERIEKEDRDFYDKNYEALQKRLLPQKDVCIDILCRSKDETIDSVIERVIKNLPSSGEDVLFVYLSKGTESDIPLIVKCYSSKYKFIAIGSEEVSERLRRAGVIVLGSSIEEALCNFLKTIKRDCN